MAAAATTALQLGPDLWAEVEPVHQSSISSQIGAFKSVNRRDHFEHFLASIQDVEDASPSRELVGFPITVEQCQVLSQALIAQRHLQSLTIRSCTLTDGHVAALCEGLRSNTSLVSLALDDAALGASSLRLLLEALSENQRITELRLWKNALGADAAVLIRDFAKRLSSLRVLDLGCNNLGPGSAIALSDACQQAAHLVELSLASNGIGPMGADAIANVLPSLQSLTSLNLCWNQIGDAGVISIAGALPRAPKLVRLDLRWNGITADGAAPLLAALNQCPAFEQLKVLGHHSNDVSAVRYAITSKLNAQRLAHKAQRSSVPVEMKGMLLSQLPCHRRRFTLFVCACAQAQKSCLMSQSWRRLFGKFHLLALQVHYLRLGYTSSS